MGGPSATPSTYPYQNEPIWSRPEKAIGHKVCDAAPKRELRETMQEVKRAEEKGPFSACLAHFSSPLAVLVSTF